LLDWRLCQAYNGFLFSAITETPHPEKLPKPECAGCHERAAQLYKSDFHSTMGFICVRCHNVHFLDKERKTCVSCHGSAKHAFLPGRERHLQSLPCLACHGRPDKTSLRVQVTIKGKNLPDAALFQRGSHVIDRDEWLRFQNLLQTSFKGKYSIEKRYGTSGGAHTVTAKPVPCGTCHAEGGYFSDALLKVIDSATYEMPIDRRAFIPVLPVGEDFAETVHGKNGVKCVDCHESGRKAPRGWAPDPSVCRKCHGDVWEERSQSVHAKEGAAQCIDCHNPHRIKSYRDLSAEARVAICARCHGDYLEKHGWLPNTRLHFGYLECATCHSPKSQKSIVFYFAEEGRRKVPLSYERLVALYGKNPASFIEGGIDREVDSRIGGLLSVLRGRDKRIMLDASIIVTKVYHNHTERPIGEKKCLPCHSRQAGFYDSMFFELPGKETAEYTPVRGTALSSYPIGTFVDLFLLGEDNLTKSDFWTLLGLKKHGEKRRLAELGFKLIDLFGLLLIFLVLAGICIHLILRLLVRR